MNTRERSATRDAIDTTARTDMPGRNALTADLGVTRICGQRDRALLLAKHGAAFIAEGHKLMAQAAKAATEAADGNGFYLVDRSQDALYSRLFDGFDHDGSLEMFRKHLDACIWMRLLRDAGIERLMDATAREDHFKNLSEDVPEINEDNIWETIGGLHNDAALIFQRGLAHAFSSLDKRFKSHDAFQIESRIILTGMFDAYGYWNHYAQQRTMLSDVERILAVLDGKEPDPGALFLAVDDSRRYGHGPRQGVAETPYLRIRTFMNGNAHLWFTRPDLVVKANEVLAAYYGAVLPDAAPADEEPITVSGLPAKNLSFYATPPAVVEKLMHLVLQRCVTAGAKALEPSAGTGSIARALMQAGYAVDAVEIDHGRATELRQHRGLSVYEQNFLRMVPRASYDLVAMNPPFSGVHWMDHVVHAFEFLKPGGRLFAVLPASAEVNETPKHEKFRAWASKHCDGSIHNLFHALPAESFASSGTRVSTVILSLRRKNP